MGTILKNFSKNIITAVMFRVLLVLLLLSCVIITTTKLMEYNELQKEKETLEMERYKLIEKNEELGFYCNSEIGQEHIERFSRGVDPNSTILYPQEK